MNNENIVPLWRMKNGLIKTRRGKLKRKLEEQVVGTWIDEQQLDKILKIVDEYEKDNLETINKLKRVKSLDINRINGALKQTINSHGPITKVLIGSASKRIYGSLLIDKNTKPTLLKRIINWVKKLMK
jgi:hypothetical protein